MQRRPDGGLYSYQKAAVLVAVALLALMIVVLTT